MSIITCHNAMQLESCSSDALTCLSHYVRLSVDDVGVSGERNKLPIVSHEVLQGKQVPLDLADLLVDLYLDLP